MTNFKNDRDKAHFLSFLRIATQMPADIQKDINKDYVRKKCKEIGMTDEEIDCLYLIQPTN